MLFVDSRWEILNFEYLIQVMAILKRIWRLIILTDRSIFVIADCVWTGHFPIVGSTVFLVDATGRYDSAQAKSELHVRVFEFFYLISQKLFFFLPVDERVADAPILILIVLKVIYEQLLLKKDVAKYSNYLRPEQKK